MRIFVAMICDRHADPEAFLFTAAEAAIQFARDTAHGYARSPEDVEESDIKGWLYYATYSNESDSVWVLEKELEESD
jgi:hypothetical protein